jgi:solute carrier family 25 thiamine pyrophosphate transporter 19
MVHVPSGKDKEEKGMRRMVIDATAGAVAGCIARVLTGPLDVIKIRFQVQLEPIMGQLPQAGHRSKYTGFGQAFTTILREEGVQVRSARSDVRALCSRGSPDLAQRMH